MRGDSFVLTATAVLVALFVTSTDAFAQVDVDPTDPMAVSEDDDDASYQATVTCDYDFFFNLKVYHNGALKHNTTDFISNDGPSKVYHKTVDFTTWGLSEDDSLEFYGKATISEGPFRGTSDTGYHQVTVSGGQAMLDPSSEREPSYVRPSYAMREETA